MAEGIIQELVTARPERLTDEHVAALQALAGGRPEAFVARHRFGFGDGRPHRIEIQGGHRWLLWDGEYVRQDLVEAEMDTTETEDRGVPSK